MLLGKRVNSFSSGFQKEAENTSWRFRGRCVRDGW